MLHKYLTSGARTMPPYFPNITYQMTTDKVITTTRSTPETWISPTTYEGQRQCQLDDQQLHSFKNL